MTVDERCETLGGVVCALGLPSRRHRDLSNRIHVELSRQLEGTECEASQGEGVHVGPIDATQHTIPDVVVFCGEKRGHPDDPDVLLNPTVIVEVLGKATYARDHVDKRFAYTAIENLRAYLIVDQYQQLVIVWGRTSADWEARLVVRGRLEVPGTELVLDVDKLYADLAEPV